MAEGRREMGPGDDSSGAIPPVAVVLDCDVADGVPAVPTGRCKLALVLVRVFGEPIGLLSLSLTASGLDSSALARAIAQALGPRLRARLEQCGLVWNGDLPTDGLRPPRVPAFVEGRRRALREGPEITVAVCTRDRPEGLRAVLESLGAQVYERLRVLVVDNMPSDDRALRVVQELSQGRDIDYVRESRAGLSWARNRSIEASRSAVVAWVDDDAVCDPWWTTELARGFVDVPAADAVTGLILPSELDTDSQVWFEQYCGAGRGRGFSRLVFSPATRRVQSPLYPRPLFGSGSNMAFRRSAIERLGRFDTALGAGTAAEAGEDIAALSGLLLAGGALVYQPSALVRHRQQRDYPGLLRQQLGYGRGMGAFYASTLAHRPACVLDMVKLSGHVVGDQLSRKGRRVGELDDDVRRDLRRAFRAGLLQGPLLYALARCEDRRRGVAATGS